MASQSGIEVTAKHYGVQPPTVRDWLSEFGMSSKLESPIGNETSIRSSVRAALEGVDLADQDPIVQGQPLDFVHVSDSTDVKFGDTRYEARPSTGGSYMIVKHGPPPTDERKHRESPAGWELWIPDTKRKHRDYEGAHRTLREAMIAAHCHWAVSNAPTPDPQYADPMDDPEYSDWMAHNYPTVAAAAGAEPTGR